MPLSFRKEVENVKIWFSGHNFMTDEGGATNSWEAHSRNMTNICTKYGFDSLIISGSYGGHRRHTTPGVWHKFQTGELEKEADYIIMIL